MMKSAEIRQVFLDFFQSKGHVIVPSASIVIKNDPTLLFTNAGMNQFKDVFLGNKKAPFPRVADTQKCLRVSGKHNDLEEVGVDTYHHTMFEMLGNWSFGDYFKKEAVEWSWELLTRLYKIPTDKLYVTVFEGDQKEGLPKDDEVIEEWKKWIPEERIIMGSKKDNFWEMGDTGPCGPCTEIHIDCRTDEERMKTAGKELVNKDHPQVIEIWNNVFIQYNRLKDETLEPLPQKHVDTGMGFERLVRVLQQKTSNYDTDIFSGTIHAIEKITRKKYNASSSIDRTDWLETVAFRVIADHIRAICFTIADGQLPSNTGAGYVIRRILRRSVRYYYSYLDYKNPLLHQLVPVLAKQFESVFPELSQQQDFVIKVIREEEDAFLRTVIKGIATFNNYIIEPKGDDSAQVLPDNATTSREIQPQTKFLSYRKKKIVAGEFAFELNDTYGFPIDLTQLMAKEKGWTVDMVGFEQEMQQQKNRSRAASVSDIEDWIILDENPLSLFVGYDSLEVEAKIIKYRKAKTKGKEAYQLVLDNTPFYAESGGQVGDQGILKFNHEEIPVIDTKKENELIIHFTEQLPKDLRATVIASVDKERRRKIAIHHSATHLLHAALREKLGNHVIQKGSLVNDEHLRFDFSHFAKMSREEILEVEELVNDKIRANIPVVIREMPKAGAMQLGAMALFGEKYGETVRVIIIDPSYSIELCGGTHVGTTGELGILKIKHESAVAAGVRRIEAVSGIAATSYINEQFKLLDEIQEHLKRPKDPVRSLEGILNENAELKKKMEQMENRILVGLRNELVQKVELINGVNFVAGVLEVSNSEALKKLCYDLKNHLENYVAILCANIDGKAAVAIGIDERLVSAKNLDAGKWIKEQVAPTIKGGGGGQKTLATAGGTETGSLPSVIEKIKALL